MAKGPRGGFPGMGGMGGMGGNMNQLLQQAQRMQRDVEIVVYDSAKGFGNGALLPAGPLRESTARLKTVDAVVSNGKNESSMQADFNSVEMQLESADFYNLADNQIKCNASVFSNKKVLAMPALLVLCI